MPHIQKKRSREKLFTTSVANIKYADSVNHSQYRIYSRASLAVAHIFDEDFEKAENILKEALEIYESKRLPFPQLYMLFGPWFYINFLQNNLENVYQCIVKILQPDQKRWPESVIMALNEIKHFYESADIASMEESCRKIISLNRELQLGWF